MDTWNGAIKGFDENGKQKLNLDLTRFKNFYGPRGLSFDGRDFLVADTGSHRIALLTPEGTLDASWGSSGTGAGQFKGPIAAVGDGKGTYFVADSDNNRFQVLDKDGKSVKVVKLGGSVSGVAVDREGRFYVSSAADNGSIKVYDAKGSYLGDVTDMNGSADPFRGAHFITVTSQDVLMITIGATVAMFQVPVAQPSK
jgi:WD40 repeat protein